MISLNRIAIAASLRDIDLIWPASWGFSAFSQNGEDGIIDVRTSQVIDPNRHFLEIGDGYGNENNTSWVPIGRCYAGHVLDFNVGAVELCS